jgi:hypothetical protein
MSGKFNNLPSGHYKECQIPLQQTMVIKIIALPYECPHPV